MTKNTKLTKAELREVAEILHGYDWLTEGDVLIPIYEKMVKDHPGVCHPSKEIQKLRLVQLYYMKKYYKNEVQRVS